MPSKDDTQLSTHNEQLTIPLNDSVNAKQNRRSAPLLSWQRNNFKPLHPEVIDYVAEGDHMLVKGSSNQTANAIVEEK